MIVHSDETITLIGGASLSDGLMARATSLAPRVVAADGGADTALLHGIVPEAIIGDFDSVSAAAREALPAGALHRIGDQDSTDFDKCLRNIEAPLVLGIGFAGDRIDHQMACYNSLVRHPSRRCILLSEHDLTFLAPPSLRLELEAGCPVSFFPMAAVEGISDGLRWPIGGLNFAPDGQIGTSNMAEGPVEFSFTSPKMLVMLPTDQLEPVIAALDRAAARWP